jgi:hypothetical protein
MLEVAAVEPMKVALLVLADQVAEVTLVFLVAELALQQVAVPLEQQTLVVVEVDHLRCKLEINTQQLVVMAALVLL